MSIEFKLQALKENVEIVEVNAIKVTVGDIVTKDQPLVEVQADKAALEVPSPAAGKITQILIKQGDQVKIGQLIFVIDPVGAGAAASPQRHLLFHKNRLTMLLLPPLHRFQLQLQLPQNLLP